MKPFLTDKGMSKKQITFIEDDIIISDDPEVAQTLKEPVEHIIHVNENSDPMDAILCKYLNHPTISNILRVV